MVKKNNRLKFQIFFQKYGHLIILFAILLVGAYLRLYRIADYLTFLGDEGRDVLVVKRMIVDHKFTLLGPTASVGGFFLGPIYYYFMIPFLWLFKLNPVGPAVMVAIFGTATIYLVYLLGYRLFNQRVGLISALLYCLSPVVINYSRSSWNPNLVPFFTALLILSLLKYSEVKQNKYLLMIGAILGIGLQLHYLYLFLGVFSVIYLLFVFGKRELSKFVYVLLGFLALYFPFILFELRHDFTNTRMIIKFVFGSKDTGLEAAYFVKTVFSVYFRLFQRLVVNNQIIFALIALLLSFIAWLFQFKRPITHTAKLLILWLVIPLLLFGLYKKPIYDYYFGILFPLPFLLVGSGIDQLYKKRFFNVIGILLVVIFVWFNWQARPFLTQPNKQLAQTEEVARYIFNKANNQPFNFALLSAHNSDHAYRYFFEIWGNPAKVIDNAVIDPKRTTVTKQLFVICELVKCEPLGNSLWEIAGFGRAEINGYWKVSVLDIYKLIPYKENIQSI